MRMETFAGVAVVAIALLGGSVSESYGQAIVRTVVNQTPEERKKAEDALVDEYLGIHPQKSAEGVTMTARTVTPEIRRESAREALKRLDAAKTEDAVKASCDASLMTNRFAPVHWRSSR